MMLTGAGEYLWRPLANPKTLQVSAFVDNSPGGFGLIQRKRRYGDFLDLEAKYEKRPSLWVEPIGDWGQGAVELYEIPSQREINDNIAAFWQPKQRPAKDGSASFVYRLYWCDEWPTDRKDFKAYVNDEAGREAAWTRAVAESQRLADEFAAIVERGQPFDPLPL